MKLISLDVNFDRVVGARLNDGVLIEKLSESVVTRDSQEAIFNVMYSIINKLAEKDVEGLCVSCPGLVDSFEGMCVKGPDTAKVFTYMQFKAVLENKYDVPCAVISKAQAHLLNEMHFGEGMGYRSASSIHIDRTISGAYYKMGTVIPGKNFDYGNLSHRTIDVRGAQCTCGANGCMEQYVTTTAFENSAKNAGLDITDFIQIFDKYILDDTQAKAVVRTFAMRLSQCINFMKKNFKAEIFIITGDFSGSQNIWFPILKESKAARKSVFCSKIGSDGALYGAAVWFNHRYKRGGI